MVFLAFASFGKQSGLLVYRDDVIACSATWEARLRLLKNIFRTLQAAGLTLKPSKIHFGPKEVHYLEHVLSTNSGIRMGENRIKIIVDLKTPTTIEELCYVVGTFNFVRKFIPNLAAINNPLVALIRKSVANLKALRNQSKQDAAFIKVKELLTSAPVLHFPRFYKSFIIHVDASDCGVDAFLAQKGDNNGELAIIAYFSMRFTSSQQHYSVTRKECLAVVLAVTYWRPYIWGRHFVCVTDRSALRCLYSMQNIYNMLTRWAIALQSYDFTVEH